MTHLVFWGEASTGVIPALLRGKLVPLAAPAIPILMRRRGLVAEGVRVLSQLWVSYRGSPLSVEETPRPAAGPAPGTGCPTRPSRPPGAASGCTNCLPRQACTCCRTVTRTCPGPCHWAHWSASTASPATPAAVCSPSARRPCRLAVPDSRAEPARRLAQPDRSAKARSRPEGRLSHRPARRCQRSYTGQPTPPATKGSRRPPFPGTARREPGRNARRVLAGRQLPDGRADQPAGQPTAGRAAARWPLSCLAPVVLAAAVDQDRPGERQVTSQSSAARSGGAGGRVGQGSRDAVEKRPDRSYGDPVQDRHVEHRAQRAQGWPVCSGELE